MVNLFGSKQQCTACGKTIERDARFCPHCGTPQAGGKVTCGHCGKEVPSNARHCPYCGTAMDTAQVPDLGDNRWRRGAEDFAIHVVVDDVRGFFSRDLIVEPGTQAILLADGANLGVVGPGKYTLDDLTERGEVFLRLRSAHRMEAILVDTADVELDFTINDLLTKDPLKIKASVAVAVVVENPMRFFQTLMRSQRSYSLQQLRSYLYSEVEDAAREWVGRYSIKDLSTNFRLKQDLEQDIEMHLQQTGQRNGLRFVRVRALDLAHPYLDRVTGAQAEAFIAHEEAQAQFAAERLRLERERVARGMATEEEILQRQEALNRRKALFDIYNQDQLQDLFELTRKVEQHEERARLMGRMRESILSEKMDELRGEEKMEDFLREQDKRQLLREKDWQELQQAIREGQEDHQSQRAHLLAKLSLEQQYELRQIEWLQRTDIEEAQLEFEIKQARRELEAKQALELQRWEFELQKRQREAELARQQQKVADMDRRERELQDTLTRLDIKRHEALTQAEIAALQREQDKADFDLGALALERMKAIRRQDEMERDLHQLNMERQRMEMTLAAKEREIRMQMEQQRQQQEFQLRQEKQVQDHEIDRIKTLSQASAEVVISLAGPEQARVIADLKQTEALKGMSDNQVESLMASRSPHFAQALAERWKAIEAGKATDAQKEMYERMLQQQATSDLRTEQALRDALQLQEKAASREQQTAFEAMRSVQHTAEAFARGSGQQQQPVIVVTPGMSGPAVAPVTGFTGGVGPAGSAERVVICPRCHVDSEPGVKFCRNCGYNFFGEEK